MAQLIKTADGKTWIVNENPGKVGTVRINAHQASFSKGQVLLAQKEMGRAIHAVQKKYGWNATIDVDFFDAEAGARAPLIVQMFTPSGDQLATLYIDEVEPLTENTPDRRAATADSIREAIPGVVKKVEDRINYWSG
jgi:hypothetical protein